MSSLDEPLSPELVLVAPPELAERARRLLPESPLALRVSESRGATARLEPGLVAFVGGCIASTVGPFVLALLAR